MSHERANTDDTIEDYETVTAKFLDFVLPRFTVMYRDEARQLIVNDHCFYSLATLLNELFTSRSHRKHNKAHKRTLINIVAELESRSINQHSILSSAHLHTFVAVYLLQTGSTADAMRHLKEAAERISNRKNWYCNTGFIVVYFGILRVCFEYEVEPSKALATSYYVPFLSHPGNTAWLYTPNISRRDRYHIRRSIWISAVAQGKLVFQEHVNRVETGNLSLDELDYEMDKWLHGYDYPEYPEPGSWCLNNIDQLSATDAELKFWRPIYNTTIRLVEGDLAAGSHDDETMAEFDYKADKTSYQFGIIRDFIQKSIRYVKSKQELFDVDRRCGFQKECDYLNCILQTFLVLKSDRFHKITDLPSYELSSMVSKTKKYNKKSIPPNLLCALALKKWKTICEEEHKIPSLILTPKKKKTMPLLNEEDYQSDTSQITVIRWLDVSQDPTFRWRDKSTETMFRWREKSTDKVTAVQESQTFPIDTTAGVRHIGKVDSLAYSCFSQ
ncbi:hypothetical protein TRIATDRAFT_92025 [Trichoderma atroviride IMI 206040]|uniref:Uncharacterized protein n=1 Tax=Hypocrea atroviridis (strain ATCC 20476 / IMI 206040) TaxID=452589 RepID=G9NJ09_HYPAI|nr:uncharacterized protein TRIATDRAFT_92025 [Trichoderma atroviride IMI 206040]EHK48886.1 hypothetical protein TRIATDRAFT_92025 [Trichoderma atroviride IMI 206040]